MSIETTLTLVTFFGIVGASILIRILVMVPYRLVQRVTKPETAESGWPKESRIRTSLKDRSYAIPRFFTHTAGPLAMFVVAWIAGAFKSAGRALARFATLVATSLVAGVSAVASGVTTLGGRVIPTLDRWGSWVIDRSEEASYVPAQRHSILSPNTINESLLWRAVAEGDSPTSLDDGFMHSVRRLRPHPSLAPMMMDRRQAV